VAYKIGITNYTPKERFRLDFKYISIVNTVHFSLGRDAHTMEQLILKQYKPYKYVGPDLLESGNTELFNIDIFKRNTMINTKLTKTALSKGLIKSEIQVKITKTELLKLVSDAVSEGNMAIIRALQNYINSIELFPQFPEHTNVSLGDTAEDGSTVVTLKVPRQTSTNNDSAPIQSVEPLVVNETIDEPDETESAPYMESDEVTED